MCTPHHLILRVEAFAFLAAISWTATDAAPHPWTSLQLPSPQNDVDDICQRHHVNSAVCDPDSYLSASQATKVDQLINAIYAGTASFEELPCLPGSAASAGGPQLAVALVANMAPTPSKANRKAAALQFARDLHDRWGVGNPHCQNGVVLFFAVRDHAMGFSVGSGLLDVVTGRVIATTMQAITPALRGGRYGDAVVDAVQLIGEAISAAAVGGEHGASDQGGLPDGGFDTEGRRNWLAPLWIVVAALLLCLPCCCCLHKSAARTETAARFRRALWKARADRVRAEGHGEMMMSCPVCLEDLPFHRKTGEATRGKCTEVDELERERDPGSTTGAEPELGEGCGTGEDGGESGRHADCKADERRGLTAGDSAIEYGSARPGAPLTCGLSRIIRGLNVGAAGAAEQECMLSCGRGVHAVCMAELNQAQSGGALKCPACAAVGLPAGAGAAGGRDGEGDVDVDLTDRDVGTDTDAEANPSAGEAARADQDMDAGVDEVPDTDAEAVVVAEEVRFREQRLMELFPQYFTLRSGHASGGGSVSDSGGHVRDDHHRTSRSEDGGGSSFSFGTEAGPGWAGGSTRSTSKSDWRGDASSRAPAGSGWAGGSTRSTSKSDWRGDASSRAQAGSGWAGGSTRSTSKSGWHGGSSSGGGGGDISFSFGGGSSGGWAGGGGGDGGGDGGDW